MSGIRPPTPHKLPGQLAAIGEHEFLRGILILRANGRTLPTVANVHLLIIGRWSLKVEDPGDGHGVDSKCK